MEPSNFIASEQPLPFGFVCAFCGACRPWSMLAGFDLPRRYCEYCVTFLDALKVPR